MTEPRAPRDHKAEAKAKRNRSIEKMAVVADARRAVYQRDLLQVAQVFCFCGLPYQRTSERSIVRSARVHTGHFVRVTFRAQIDGVDLPFGTDRSLLHWMTHRAVSTLSPFIPMSSASEYLRDMGMACSGQNIQRTREAFERIASFALIIERIGSNGKQQLITPIVREANMPASMLSGYKGAQLSLLDIEDDRRGFTLDPYVFRDFMQFHVPTLQAFIKSTRDTPQIQDYMLFLQWRSYVAKSDTLIPWASLREQLWSDDTNTRRTRSRFEEAITTLKIAWPALNAKATTQGLEVGPSREPFLIEGR